MSDPIDFIGKTIELNPRNDDFFYGLCPFHDDNKPSFWVNRKGSWGCFACGEKGSLIEFVYRIYDCSSYGEAREILEKNDCAPAKAFLSQSNRDWLSVAMSLQSVLVQLDNTVADAERGMPGAVDRTSDLLNLASSYANRLDTLEKPDSLSAVGGVRFESRYIAFLTGSALFRATLLHFYSLRVLGHEFQEHSIESLLERL